MSKTETPQKELRLNHDYHAKAEIIAKHDGDANGPAAAKRLINQRVNQIQQSKT